MSNHRLLTVQAVYERLYATWGPQHWWPGDGVLEMIVGAILVQSTAWRNVEIAIGRLRAAGLLSGERILQASEDVVKSAIGPAGFYNVKYKRLLHTMDYLASHNFYWQRWRSLPLSKAREELLGVKGIGPETADSILLYAFDRPVFVIDAYTRRLFARLGYGWMATSDYDSVAGFFADHCHRNVPTFNEYHALIVAQCKNVCKPKPGCDACSLATDCPEALTRARSPRNPPPAAP